MKVAVKSLNDHSYDLQDFLAGAPVVTLVSMCYFVQYYNVVYSKLKHHNLVSIIGISVSPVYIIMEYMAKVCVYCYYCVIEHAV